MKTIFLLLLSSSALVIAEELPKAFLSAIVNNHSLEVAKTPRPTFVEPAERTVTDGNLLQTSLRGEYANHKIGDDLVYLRSYAGKIVGDTLRVKPGDTITLDLTNGMPANTDEVTDHNKFNSWNNTNFHTHGLWISPQGNSDNVGILLEPSESLKYKFEIPKTHTAGTFWYHPHCHGSTAAQVASGMAGTIIIEGGMDYLPEIKKMEEQIMVLQQISYFPATSDPKSVNLAKQMYKEKFPKADKQQIEKHCNVGTIELWNNEKTLGFETWDNLGRLTTINGQQIPELSLSPGEIQRWRFVQAGVHEEVLVAVIAVEDFNNANAKKWPLAEIATDGWPTGRKIKKEHVHLYPGYRSDLLVEAPKKEGTYYLIDERTTEAIDKMDANIESEREILAVIKVEGKEVEMMMPEDSELAKFKLKTLVNEKINPMKQELVFAQKDGVDGFYTIDGRSYGNNPPRVLELGTVDEWVLNSGQSGHPFHIHVNPFEILEVGGKKLEETIWKDTIFVPEGQTVVTRTHYQRFDGSFVLHCHILDHEDHGMMQNVQVWSKEKIELDLQTREDLIFRTGDGSGKISKLVDAEGKTTTIQGQLGNDITIINYFLGEDCAHCNEQIKALVEHEDELAKQGIKILCINSESTSDSVKDEFPFPLFYDKGLQNFKATGLIDGGSYLKHGTIIQTKNGYEIFNSGSYSPFLDINHLLDEIQEYRESVPMGIAIPNK